MITREDVYRLPAAPALDGDEAAFVAAAADLGVPVARLAAGVARRRPDLAPEAAVRLWAWHRRRRAAAG